MMMAMYDIDVTVSDYIYIVGDDYYFDHYHHHYRSIYSYTVGMPAEHAKRQVIISQRPNKSNQSGELIKRHVCYKHSA